MTAERRAHQQVKYFESRGATVRWVPVLRTIEGADRSSLDAATAQIADLGIDVLVAQTGQSLTWWLDTVSTELRSRLDAALATAEVLTRGPKATSAARRQRLDVVWQSNRETTDDVIDHIAGLDLTGRRVGVLLDGNDDHRLVDTVQARGAELVELHVYQYALPDRHDEVVQLVDDIVAGRLDVVTFTASPAIRHLRSIADSADRGAALDAALSGVCRPAVVGPVCAATAIAAGWSQIIEPATARLVPMLDAVTAALVEPSSA